MYKNNLLCAAILATSAMLINAQDEASLFAKPSKTPQTILLTAGAGTLTTTACIYALSALCNSLDITKVNMLAGIGGALKLGPVNFFSAAYKEFTAPANYVIGTIGLSLGALAAWAVYRCQPEGKFGRAHDALTEALTDETLNELLAAEQELLSNIEDSYIQFQYPRVAAYNEFVTYHKKLTDAITLLNEATEKADNDDFTELAENCLIEIKKYVNAIKDCINIIRNSPDWIKQLKAHDVMLTREAQERAAIAAQQIAMNSYHCHTRC